ncbi:MAG: hypothetical protein ACT4O1_16115 [Gemmatimonadota bacterium]
MPELSPREQLELAKSHLHRVQVASWEPVDWADIGNYGLYAEKHDLPDVATLMVQLNETRKASNYGDIEAPDLDADDVASEIEEFVASVEELLQNYDEKDAG